jgi:hypothetical protein
MTTISYRPAVSCLMTFSLIFVSTRCDRNVMSLQDLHEGDGDHSQSNNYYLLSLGSRLEARAGATVNRLAMAKPV